MVEFAFNFVCSGKQQVCLDTAFGRLQSRFFWTAVCARSCRGPGLVRTPSTNGAPRGAYGPDDVAVEEGGCEAREGWEDGREEGSGTQKRKKE